MSVKSRRDIQALRDGSIQLDNGACVGPKNSHWKGGTNWQNGYLFVWCPEIQTYRKNADLVLERKIGRPLAINELAHHKNEIKSDDSPENLELMTVVQHRAYHNALFSRKIVRQDNTTGVTGVNFNNKTRQYRVRIQVNGKRIQIGEFKTLDEAISARKKAEEDYVSIY